MEELVGLLYAPKQWQVAGDDAEHHRRSIYLIAKRNLRLPFMEAFDQPWKQDIEGAVGAYWGLWNDERIPKFEFIEPIVQVPWWPLLSDPADYGEEAATWTRSGRRLGN